MDFECNLILCKIRLGEFHVSLGVGKISGNQMSFREHINETEISMFTTMITVPDTPSVSVCAVHGKIKISNNVSENF